MAAAEKGRMGDAALEARRNPETAVGPIQHVRQRRQSGCEWRQAEAEGKKEKEEKRTRPGPW